MKCIIRSVKPYWFYLICERQKTIEVGKNHPAEWENVPVYLYCTKDIKSFNQIPVYDQEQYRKYLGMVGACFIPNVMEMIPVPIPHDKYFSNILSKTCLTEEQINSYGKNYQFLVGWNVDKLITIENPKSITDFYKNGFDTFNTFYAPVDTRDWRLTAPPQSWYRACY